MAQYDILHEGAVVGHYELAALPGCCKVCVSNRLWIDPAVRGKGIGKRAMEERLQLAKSLGYKIIVATVNDANKAQEKILTAYGWRRVTFYDNAENGNRIAMWYRHLDDPYEEAQGFKMGCR